MRYATLASLLILLAFTPRAAAQFAVSPDGKRAAVGVGNAIKIDDIASMKELIRIQGHSQLVTALAYTPDGRLLVSGSLDKTVKLWDAATGRQIRAIQIDAAVMSVTSNGKTVTIVDDKKKTREFEIDSGKEVKK